MNAASGGNASRTAEASRPSNIFKKTSPQKAQRTQKKKIGLRYLAVRRPGKEIESTLLAFFSHEEAVPSVTGKIPSPRRFIDRRKHLEGNQSEAQAMWVKNYEQPATAAPR
jgi:hypothetical protein